MLNLAYAHRAGELEYKYLDASGSSSRLIMTCIMPLSEILTDFFDKLKSRSSGFASFEFVSFVVQYPCRCADSTVSYEDAGYQKADVAKVRLLLAHVVLPSHIISR
jgi:hypothetical protein